MRKTSYSLIRWLMFAGLIAVAGFAVTRFRRSAPPQSANAPCTLWQRPGVHGIVDFFFHETSLNGLASQAKVIVEALVESTGPGIAHNNRFETKKDSANIETDALLTVTSVLKGPADLKQIAVSVYGANGLYEMMPGQRFILFLAEERPGRREKLAERPEVPRYGITGDYSGMFCIDGDKVRLSPSSEMYGQLDRTPREKVLADIRELALTR